MYTQTRLSEKLNNKRGASILVALVLFLVVTMTSVLVLTAVSANAGRLEQQRTNEAAQVYVDSLVSVLNYQIDNTDMTVTFPIREGATEEEMENDPISCIGAIHADKYISTESRTLFCAEYINETVDKMIDFDSNGKVVPATRGNVTQADCYPSYTASDASVSKAFNGLTARIKFNGMDRNNLNFSIAGYIQVRKNGENVALVNFNMPATVKAYSDKSVDWNDNKKASYDGKVVVQWGKLVTY